LFKKSSLTFVQSTEYPDSYIKNLVAVQMSKEGLPEERLESSYLMHYPKDNTVHLQDPFVTLYQEGVPPWELRARTSIAYPDLNEIKLIDEVVAHQAAFANNPQTTLLTHEATLYTDKKLVVTGEPVTMLRPGLRVKSLGVRANIKEKEIILSSNAQVFYNTKQADNAAQ
jgi:lipopolysaccharide export system protein LptC